MRALGFTVGTALALGLVAVVLSGRLVVVNPPPEPAPQPRAAAADGAADAEPAPPAGEQPTPPPAQGFGPAPESEPGGAPLDPLPEPADPAPIAAAPEPSRLEPRAAAPSPADLGDRSPEPPRPAERPSQQPSQQLDPLASVRPPSPPPTPPPRRSGARSEPSEPAAGGSDQPAVAPRDWESFWGPFNTRASAAGFASTLSKQTGIDLKAVEASAGRYMIAFPYSSEQERQSARETIAQETGLRLR